MCTVPMENDKEKESERERERERERAREWELMWKKWNLEFEMKWDFVLNNLMFLHYNIWMVTLLGLILILCLNYLLIHSDASMRTVSISIMNLNKKHIKESWAYIKVGKRILGYLELLCYSYSEITLKL